MVDEVDSVLIDDARTPLIISGPVPKGDQHEFHELKPRIERLVNVQKNYLNTALNQAKKQIAEGNTEEGGLALLRAHRGLPKNKRSEEHTSELQSLMRISYAVFCLKKKKTKNMKNTTN